jgi:hypothetical protein
MRTLSYIDGDYMEVPITKGFFAGNPEKAEPDVRTFKIAPGTEFSSARMVYIPAWHQIYSETA